MSYEETTQDLGNMPQVGDSISYLGQNYQVTSIYTGIGQARFSGINMATGDLATIMLKDYNSPANEIISASSSVPSDGQEITISSGSSGD